MSHRRQPRGPRRNSRAQRTGQTSAAQEKRKLAARLRAELEEEIESPISDLRGRDLQDLAHWLFDKVQKVVQVYEIDTGEPCCLPLPAVRSESTSAQGDAGADSGQQVVSEAALAKTAPHAGPADLEPELALQVIGYTESEMLEMADIYSRWAGQLYHAALAKRAPGATTLGGSALN